MALYKVTKAEEANTYYPPAHHDVRCTNLHQPSQVDNGEISLGLSHFLPGGGADMGPCPVEMFYYIISGEMTITTLDDGVEVDHVLHAGDTIHYAKGCQRAAKNTGIVTAQMLVCLVTKN